MEFLILNTDYPAFLLVRLIVGQHTAIETAEVQRLYALRSRRAFVPSNRRLR